MAGKLQLRFLPGFAEFIKNEKLVDYIKLQIRYSRELKIPLLRFFEKMSESDLVSLSIVSTTEFLDAIIHNRVKEHIEVAQKKWIENQLEIIDKHDVAPEDITLVSLVRKRAMMAILPEYTAIVADVLAIVAEIDIINAESDTYATATYMRIVREKLNEHSHFIERITETSPGIIYVFDLLDDKEVYANKMMSQLLGYEADDWKSLDAKFVEQLIHPEDIQIIENNQRSFATAEDGDIRSIQYRIKNKSGKYRWMRTYESIFKRKDDGTPWQVIGIALDIQDEKFTADKLQNSEQQLLEAQALANIGSFMWNPETGERESTPEFLKILEFDQPQGMELFFSKIHPGDRAIVKAKLEELVKNRIPVDVEFRYEAIKKQKILWLKATSTTDKNFSSCVKGTLMDVSDRHYMVQKLQRSEDINKKAQTLTHIGNWTLDLKNQKLEWSDELYRIYDLPIGSPITRELLHTFNHADDHHRIMEIVDQSYKTNDSYDFYYRIILKNGVVKTLHAIGEILADESGIPYKAIGTLQDVTEKEELIERLKNSEVLYKQAQSLSHMGNWRLNVQTQELEWSDEMYRIYGLEPQSEKITVDRFKSFIHPDDKVYIEKSLAEGITKNKYDDVFKIITNTGEVKVLHSVSEMQYDKNGEPECLIGTEQDVTEKEELITQLQNSRALYKKALEMSKIGNWSWDVVNSKVEWDEQTYQIWEIKPADNIQLNLDFYINHVPEEQRKKVKEEIENAFQLKQSFDITHRIQIPNGKLKYIHAKGDVILNEKGDIIKMLGTCQDVTERELLIDSLQRSESLYKQAQSIAHLGNWIYDVKENRLFWTDELYRIYGMEPQSEELSWENFLKMVHEDDREVVAAFTSEALKSGKPFEMYHRNTSKEGKIRTIHVRGEGLLNDNGDVYQLFGTSQDVTEQQRIEQELRENQTFIKKIADATPSIITTYNINTGKYRFISEGIRSLLGYEPEDAMKVGVEFFANLMHPSDIVPVMQKNAKALETANAPDNEDNDLILDFQYRMKRKDGEYRWFHTFGTVFDRNAQGKVENVLNISIDITDRVKAEETVIEQQKFISHIAEASPTILYLFDLEEKKFLYLNKEVTEVLGYTPEEILSLGDKVYMYLHPEDSIKSSDTYVKYKHENAATMHQFEGRIKNRAGDWKWLLTREVVFKRNEDGKATQVLGSALDITDRKEMERNLSRKNVELEQSNSNLEEFAYVASHDLQEPLRKISIFGDRLLLNHSENLNEDGQVFLQKIVDSSKRMQAMINDLLSVSLISGDKSFEQNSLKSILDDVLQTLEFKIEAKNATVTADELPSARVIPSQMRQLFQNLISNSLKFISPGKNPEINITHSLLKNAQAAAFHLPPGKQYLQVNVKDNGIGFENEYASKIFTIFQRLHGKAEYEGTGIGLAICKKIIENHEGAIFAEGQPSIGATFSFIIPI